MPGALGIKTVSYGLLPNGGSARKQSAAAAALGLTREKESFWLRWIQRVPLRRNVGMFFLILMCAGAILGLVHLLPFTRGVNISEGPLVYTNSLDHAKFIGRNPTTSSDNLRPLVSGDDKRNVNRTVITRQPAGEVETENQHPSSVLRKYFTPHPCESFSFPPPPLRNRRPGPRPCPVCYLPAEQAMAVMPVSPSVSPILKNLTYHSEENLITIPSNGGSIFGGHQSLQHRNDSFDIKKSMTVHCGFFKGKKPGHGTGFDIDGRDLDDMERCHGVVVASAIFGNYDILQQPRNISEVAKRSTCFFMFVDEETQAFVKNTTGLDNTKEVGLWRMVVVRNLPFVDPRRNGKVPKLLLHRLFPNARFSIWIDGKLELVVDPYRILERFLWRKNATFAISNHYRRHDVFEEAIANKAAGKYDNASIDFQVEFYTKEGLSHYSPAKLPIPSDVPEGCVIIREHTPLTNLFTCLWFNEVDRFTSRDQLSFSTVRDKIMSRVNWTPNMFLDCERRNFVIQAYHLDVLKQMQSPPSLGYLPPLSTHGAPKDALPNTVTGHVARPPARKQSRKHGRDKKSGSKRHRDRAPFGRDIVWS